MARLSNQDIMRAIFKEGMSKGMDISNPTPNNEAQKVNREISDSSFVGKLRNSIRNIPNAINDNIERRRSEEAASNFNSDFNRDFKNKVYRSIDNWKGQLGGLITEQKDTGYSGYNSYEEDPNAYMDENGDIHPVDENAGTEDSEEIEVEVPDYDVDEMAGEFILGAWGNGQDRIDNMISAGYSLDDYNKIQQRVNDAYESGRDLRELTDRANEKLRYW